MVRPVADTVQDVDVFASYPSWWSFVEAADGPLQGFRGDRVSRQVGTGRYERWAGTGTWEECLTLAREGWPEGCERVKAVLANVKASMAAVTRASVQPHVVGRPVVARALMGHPVSMARLESRPDAGRVVRIGLTVGVSGDVKPEAIERRGAAVAALVQALQAAGRPVEVVVYDAGKTDKSYMIRVTLLSPGQTLDVDVLAMALVNPATPRRLMFSWLETREGAEELGAGAGYGIPADIPQGEKDALDVYLGTQVIGKGWDTPEGIAAWVNEQLRAQGVSQA